MSKYRTTCRHGFLLNYACVQKKKWWGWKTIAEFSDLQPDLKQNIEVAIKQAEVWVRLLNEKEIT